MELLDKLQKRLCEIVGPSLAVSVEPLATLVDIHLNWLSRFHCLILEGGPLVILIDCIIFLSRFLDVTKMSMSTVSFLVQLDSGIVKACGMVPSDL